MFMLLHSSTTREQPGITSMCLRVSLCVCYTGVFCLPSGWCRAVFFIHFRAEYFYSVLLLVLCAVLQRSLMNRWGLDGSETGH